MGFLKKIGQAATAVVKKPATVLKKAANVTVAAGAGFVTGGVAGAGVAAARQTVRESRRGKPTALNLRSVGQSAATGAITRVAVGAASKLGAAATKGAAAAGKGAAAAKGSAFKALGAKVAAFGKSGGLTTVAGQFLARGAKSVGELAQGVDAQALAKDLISKARAAAFPKNPPPGFEQAEEDMLPESDFVAADLSGPAPGPAWMTPVLIISGIFAVGHYFFNARPRRAA